MIMMSDGVTRWWIIEFKSGRLRAVNEAFYYPASESELVPVSTFEQACSAYPLTRPDHAPEKIEAFPDHNIPHAWITSSCAETSEFIVVESTNLLDAAVKSSGLLSIRRGRTF